MKRVTTLAALLLSGGLSYGASLSVYQDKTFYNFNPKNNFIGFTEGVKATCEGAAIPISVTPDCPSDERLCQLLASLKTSEQKLRSVQANSKVLEALSSLPRPATFDTDLLIDSAKRIGEARKRAGRRSANERRCVSKAGAYKTGCGDQTAVQHRTGTYYPIWIGLFFYPL